MKKIFTIIIIIIATGQTLAQNLVSNYSFENFTICPFSTGALNQAMGWVPTAHTPDYFHSCTTSPNTDVPSNICGYQLAATGNAYIGLLFYGSFAQTLSPDTREFATGTLSQPLNIGTTYYVSFKVARMNASSHAVDHLGAKFSMTNAPVSISNSSDIFTTSVISDTLNWTLVQGSFIADSAYGFITIGNHFDDANTTAASLQPVTFGYNGYYFVDDICVTEDPLGCPTNVGLNDALHNENVTVFPNPFNNNLNIVDNTYKTSEIFIYDMFSRILLQKTFNGYLILETDRLAKGMYLYEIRNITGVAKKGKILKN